MMTDQHPFKWRHFQAEIILLCVRWYLRYSLRYRDLEEILLERGLSVDHTTIYRWVQRYAPELEKRCRPHLKACNDAWRVDETYIKVKKPWMYLYRAVASDGQTLEFLLSSTRDAEAAKRFFCKVLHTIAGCVSQGGPFIPLKKLAVSHFSSRKLGCRNLNSPHEATSLVDAVAVGVGIHQLGIGLRAV